MPSVAFPAEPLNDSGAPLEAYLRNFGLNLNYKANYVIQGAYPLPSPQPCSQKRDWSLVNVVGPRLGDALLGGASFCPFPARSVHCLEWKVCHHGGDMADA